MKRKKNKSHIHIVLICETEREDRGVHESGRKSCPCHALFVLGGQGFPADLFRLVIILPGRFWVCLHVSAVEAGKKEEKTMNPLLLT